MEKRTEIGQSEVSIEKNAKFFLDEYKSYKTNVESIDTYSSISSALGGQLQGMKRLLDIGNGGVFDYDTAGVGEIVGLDLFLDNLPSDIVFPDNVRMVQGSALDIPKELTNFDGVVMVMLIHHLVGRTISGCFDNIKQLLLESHRVMRPGGKLVIMESCVPTWFFGFEKVVYVPATFVIEKTMKHPPTLQYPAHVLRNMIEDSGFSEVKMEFIKKGRYVLQYGLKVPSWITPVQPVLFTAVRV